MFFRNMVADSKDMESDTGLHSQITYLALYWAKLFILQFFIKTRATSIKAKGALNPARSMRFRVQSSLEVMMGNRNQIIHACSGTSQPQPFRIFTIRHPIAEFRSSSLMVWPESARMQHRI